MSEWSDWDSDDYLVEKRNSELKRENRAFFIFGNVFGFVLGVFACLVAGYFAS